METKEKEISSSEADFAKVKAKAEAIDEECKQAIEKAENSIDSGKAFKALNNVIKFTTTWG